VTWLDEYAIEAARTDRFAGAPKHLGLLAAGLDGETGSIVAEVKKAARERDAYPVYRQRLVEEIGDALWYLVRLRDVSGESGAPDVSDLLLSHAATTAPLDAGLRLAAAAGTLCNAVTAPGPTNLRESIREVAAALCSVAAATRISLEHAAKENVAKITSRWPAERSYHPLFDNDSPEEDRLPRRLDIEFRELSRGSRQVTLLRCNNLNFGDRVTDNIEDPDGYRYHDIFHFAHAVHLGWSPVVRALLRAKRKSDAAADEEQDGARAVILEEAVAAIVFSRAKHLAFFDGLDHVDYDLLKTVHGFVEGYEVADVPLWQWEQAILDGYRIFRLLRVNRGGRVTLDLANRSLHYVTR